MRWGESIKVLHTQSARGKALTRAAEFGDEFYILLSQTQQTVRAPKKILKIYIHT